MFDLVVVYHNEETRLLAEALHRTLESFEAPGSFRWIAVDNREVNRGFGPACNLGASEGSGDVIGFLNPDLRLLGAVLPRVRAVFESMETVAITGASFAKPRRELDAWGVRNWVCGAAFFVRRSVFDALGGFDEQFVWSWEETDLVRRVEARGFDVLPLSDLPLRHDSPGIDTPYKRKWFAEGGRRFEAKWGAEPQASIIVATFGDLSVWGPISERALASAHRQRGARVEVIRVHGETLAQARNDGAAKARAPWLCFLDADDELADDYIQQALGGVGDIRVPSVAQVRNGQRGRPAQLPRRDLTVGNWIVVGALVRADLFRRSGGFREWAMYEDWELWLRMSRAGADVRPCVPAVYVVHFREGSRNEQADVIRRRVTGEILRANGVG